MGSGHWRRHRRAVRYTVGSPQHRCALGTHPDVAAAARLNSVAPSVEHDDSAGRIGCRGGLQLGFPVLLGIAAGVKATEVLIAKTTVIGRLDAQFCCAAAAMSRALA